MVLVLNELNNTNTFPACICSKCIVNDIVLNIIQVDIYKIETSITLPHLAAFIIFLYFYHVYNKILDKLK